MSYRVDSFITCNDSNYIAAVESVLWITEQNWNYENPVGHRLANFFSTYLAHLIL
jgi:hypothetical protein